ncbi:aromatic amino acid aminotransferase [Tyzzerella sp. An114]|uniref:aminotransferase class I/II-fold pyridoxal phosphate-dependent enzyme n=1 Tax=Tyzzerella sp. An114 TaxID=1965545 RepID=UPI000B438D35|nr:aminotransferase class I/II-fold pyridoxal phosphate-dependent enzyme [Tyzzerella sp. An114]OUQ59867.1 aromatic amino acid aminotransferase [Tyzzerella sp. An114]
MSKQYIAKSIEKMPTSGIRKFFDVVSTMEGVISLGVGEPDFETPWHVREEAITSIEKGKTAYTSNQGMVPLRQAIADYLYEKYDIKYDAEKEVLITVGASEGIDLALRAICEIGDEVLVVEPSYVSYKPCVVMAGGVPIPLTTKEENDFRLTVSDIEEKITDKTKAIILPYPNNPTGAIMEKKDLEAISDIIIKNDLVVISDEIYGELTYGRKHVSIASLPGMHERTIVLNGFSKAFAMTGWRLGYAAAPKPFIKQMTKIHQYIIMCAPTMSQYAGLEALTSEEREEDIDIMREAYDERRRVMVDGFRNMGLSCFEPMGAFYVFPCIKSTGLTSEEFCERLLYEENVAVVPGTAFGECGEGFIRCSYAYSIESIKGALERIEKFVKRIKNENN